MTPEQADESKWSHVLWNALGADTPKVTPDVYKQELKLGDTLLLCSDGLSGYVADREIAAILERDLPARETCEQLIAAANEAGGKDNITAIVARFKDARQAIEEQRLAAEIDEPRERRETLESTAEAMPAAAVAMGTVR